MYSFIVPPELVSKIYHVREAKITPSIRNFIICAIEMHLKGLVDCKAIEFKDESNF